MKKVILLFPSILELLDFASVITSDRHQIDHRQLMISGHFEEVDIELAKAGYKAVIIADDQTGEYPL